MQATQISSALRSLNRVKIAKHLLSHHKRPLGEGLVFGMSHLLFGDVVVVIETNQVQNTVCDDAVQFILKGNAVVAGVIGDALSGDVNVRMEPLFVAFGVVKGQNIGIIVVLEAFAVEL